MTGETNRATLPGGRRNLAKSATRALDVLEHFAQVKRPLRATEIARSFGWHSSSTDQLLKTMVDSGYLIFETARKLYRPSPRLVRFGAWLSADYFGGERLHRLLGLVHGRSGEIVTLAVRQDDQMQVVDVVEPLAAERVTAKGVRVPVIGSVLGLAYLAARSDSEVRQILARIDRYRRGADRTEAVLDEVRAVRTLGYAAGATAVEDPSGERSAMAMALPPCDAGVGLVLGFAGPAERIRSHEPELAALMRRCIAEVLAP